jgi:hypothetical protein
MAAWAADDVKPPEQPTKQEQRVKLSKDQLSKISAAGNHHNGNSWQAHDNGGGNDPGGGNGYKNGNGNGPGQGN